MGFTPGPFEILIIIGIGFVIILPILGIGYMLWLVWQSGSRDDQHGTNDPN